jgi:hypothetical protein
MITTAQKKIGIVIKCTLKKDAPKTIQDLQPNHWPGNRLQNFSHNDRKSLKANNITAVNLLKPAG